ncbi:MAG: MCP four helix bundle domain-containing protein, partial [Nitrospinae bacterium]|nr:MCP four helix bundle domain-containing protein [Nitrospinota bacterium]
MSTKKKLQVIVVIAVITVLSISVWIYRKASAINGMVKINYEEHFVAAINSAELKADLNGVRAMLVTMVTEQDRVKLDTYHQKIKEITKDIDERLNNMLNNKAFPEDMINDIKKINEQWVAFRDTRDNELIPAIYAGNIEKVKGLALGIQAERYKRFIELSSQLIKKETKESSENLAESSNEAQRIKNGFIVISTSLIIGCLILSWFVLRYIIAPLHNGVELTEGIAEGDLTRKIDASMIDREDEIGHLMKSLDKMSHSLNDFMTSVVSSSTQIASASEELSASATQIAKGSQSQTEKATTVAASAEEMSATVIEVAKNASGASESA